MSHLQIRVSIFVSTSIVWTFECFKRYFFLCVYECRTKNVPIYLIRGLFISILGAIRIKPCHVMLGYIDLTTYPDVFQENLSSYAQVRKYLPRGKSGSEDKSTYGGTNVKAEASNEEFNTAPHMTGVSKVLISDMEPPITDDVMTRRINTSRRNSNATTDLFLDTLPVDHHLNDCINIKEGDLLRPAIHLPLKDTAMGRRELKIDRIEGIVECIKRRSLEAEPERNNSTSFNICIEPLRGDCDAAHSLAKQVENTTDLTYDSNKRRSKQGCRYEKVTSGEGSVANKPVSVYKNEIVPNISQSCSCDKNYSLETPFNLNVGKKVKRSRKDAPKRLKKLYARNEKQQLDISSNNTISGINSSVQCDPCTSRTKYDVDNLLSNRTVNDTVDVKSCLNASKTTKKLLQESKKELVSEINTKLLRKKKNVNFKNEKCKIVKCDEEVSFRLFGSDDETTEERHHGRINNRKKLLSMKRRRLSVGDLPEEIGCPKSRKSNRTFSNKELAESSIRLCKETRMTRKK